MARIADRLIGADSVSGWFRQLYKANPKYINTKSNKEVIALWLKDHAGYTEMPDRVKANMANVKSQMRKKYRKRGRKPGAQAAAQDENRVAPVGAAGRKLEVLEEQIDDCMTLAKNLDREGLSSVIKLLRRARNEVVWKSGQ